tara:strand:- start:7516 stop:7719 length:204 start_codon:yes stop_codon:yes gene_type:complete
LFIYQIYHKTIWINTHYTIHYVLKNHFSLLEVAAEEGFVQFDPANELGNSSVSPQSLHNPELKGPFG